MDWEGQIAVNYKYLKFVFPGSTLLGQSGKQFRRMVTARTELVEQKRTEGGTARFAPGPGRCAIKVVRRWLPGERKALADLFAIC